jgi:hypothetical protein
MQAQLVLSDEDRAYVLDLRPRFRQAVGRAPSARLDLRDLD